MCLDVKPNLNVYRARFSEITAASVFRALNDLQRPNKNVSDAVDVRQELDLRTGKHDLFIKNVQDVWRLPFIKKIWRSKLAGSLKF